MEYSIQSATNDNLDSIFEWFYITFIIKLMQKEKMAFGLILTINLHTEYRLHIGK
jgi:hypothetical protein